MGGTDKTNLYDIVTATMYERNKATGRFRNARHKSHVEITKRFRGIDKKKTFRIILKTDSVSLNTNRVVENKESTRFIALTPCYPIQCHYQRILQ